MKIQAHNGEFRPPICAEEYFTILYCQRRQLKPWKCREVTNVWRSLKSAEKKVFSEKFERWQSENSKKITTILEYAEPFLKRKSTKKKGNVESNLNKTKDEYDDKPSADTIIDMSSSNSGVSKQENLNVEFYMDDYDDHQSESMMNLVYDDTPNTTVELSKSSTSVIDADIDEPAAPEEINEPMTETLPEPTPLPLIGPKQLFDIIKSSGTRPQLVAVEWKDLPQKQKTPWLTAVHRMRREYLIKYRQYLESLPSPELFKHYNKFKMGN